MRIALDAHMVGERETGNETYTLNLLRGLAEDSWDDHYDVLTPHPERLLQVIRLPQRFEPVRVWPGYSIVRIPIATPALLWLKHSEILHVSYIAPPWVPCKTIVTIHDLSYLVYPYALSPRARTILRLLVPQSVRRATRVIAVSEHTKRDLVRLYGLSPEKIAVIYEAAGPAFGPRPDAARLPLPPGVNQPFVLAVGNLEPRKNIPRLIDAFASLVRERQYPGSLVIVGKVKFRSGTVFETVRRLGLEGRVIFTGFIEDEDLNLLYNRAELLAYPSLYEGFGLPPIEAMACGCPVVASNVSALPETLGDAALLVDPRSTRAMVEAMAAVVERQELAKSLRERGPHHAAAYSWRKTAAKTRAVYHEALTKEGVTTGRPQ